MEIIIKLLLSYFLGSISGSLVLGKFKDIDIRNMGSGNAGGTNAFRTQGALFASGVLFIDILKGYISTKFISFMHIPLVLSCINDQSLLVILCGISAILGHVYPVFHGFKGGKGGGAAIGMVCAIYWPATILAIIVWLIILLCSGYVGLSTILASTSVIFSAYHFSDIINNIFFLPFSIILSIFIIYTHRSNIKRMLSRTENQFEKVMIFRKKN